MPPRARPIQVSLIREGQLRGRFSLLIVTTLEKLLLGARAGAADKTGSMKLMAVDQRLPALFRMLFASLSGQLGKHKLSGIHLRSAEHTSELQSLMRLSYAVLCLKKQKHSI